MKRQLLLAAIAALLLPAALRADTINFSGSTLGGPAFLRPTETGARSFFTVAYNVYQFSVTTSGPFNFTLNAVDPASYDTFLHLYVNAFNPADISDPATNFLRANDDANPIDSTFGSALTNLTLNSGSTYFLVIDGFSTSDAGAYVASISGPGTINVVPEPSTFALLGLAGVAAMIVVRRRALSSRS